MPKALDLVGTFEIEHEYGIKRHRVFRLIKRGLWPAEAAKIHAGGVWHRRDVVAAIKRLKAQGLL